MIKIIKEYQNQYIKLLKEFKKIQNKCIKDYYLIFDKIELLYKRNKKTILNYIENKKDFVCYGGATYFNQKRQEILPIIFANKKLLVADPILKLSIFLKITKYVNQDRIKEIIDRAIEHTIEIENELKEGYIIYINLDDILPQLNDQIKITAEELTLQYLNVNLNVDFKSLKDIEEGYKDYNYKLLNEKFPGLNELINTVDAEPNDSLEEKIDKNFFYSGIEDSELTDVQKAIITLMGLFGQAFSLKTISLYLNIPLYINRVNVLLYLNFINIIDDEDKNNMFETNILFSLYIFFREYKFIDDYSKIERYSKDNNVYVNILKSCNKEKMSVDCNLKKIEEIFKDINDIESIMIKLCENN